MGRALRQDDIAVDRGDDIVEQRDAVDRLAPWLRFGKFKLVALRVIAAIEPKHAALAFDCGVEQRER